MTDTRSTIATALSLGAGKVTPYYRQSLKPGDGFVRFAGRGRDASGFGWVDTWEVWTALPANLVDAEKWLDVHLDQLLTAAAPVLVVTEIKPAELVIGTNSLNGFIITGASPV